MTDPMSASLNLAAPSRRDRRIVLTASVSVLVHLVLLALLVLPRLQPQDAADPAAIAVELVPAAPSLQPAPSSEMPSSEPASAQQPSSASASASEQPSSAAPASEPASAQPSSAAPSSAAAAAASAARPVKGARPVIIPVGPSALSSEPSAEDMASASDASAAASEPSSALASSAAASAEASALTATDTAASDVIGADSAPAADPASALDEPLPPGSALMHAAKRFYLASILSAPGMARAKAAIKTLPAQRRLTQTCMLEAIGQIGNTGGHYRPDAVINNAFAEPSGSGTSFSAPGAAFRSGGRWYAISYDCTLSKDLSAVTGFSYHLGEDVTAALEARGKG